MHLPSQPRTLLMYWSLKKHRDSPQPVVPESTFKPIPKPQTIRPRPVPKPRTKLPKQPSPSAISSTSTPLKDVPSSPRRTILIIGDSIPKHLVGRRMSRRYKVINRCIPGTTLEQWNKLAPVFVEDEMPTAVIIHCGTNNIHRSLTTECLELLDSIINAVLNVDSSINILISSLTTQRHTGHSIWIQEFNARLRDMCSLRSWTYMYIDNSNINNNNNINNTYRAPYNKFSKRFTYINPKVHYIQI